MKRPSSLRPIQNTTFLPEEFGFFLAPFPPGDPMHSFFRFDLFLLFNLLAGFPVRLQPGSLSTFLSPLRRFHWLSFLKKKSFFLLLEVSLPSLFPG